MYSRPEEANLRLKRSLIRLDGKPFYVSECEFDESKIEYPEELYDEDGNQTPYFDEIYHSDLPLHHIGANGSVYEDVGTSNFAHVKLNDPRLNFEPVPLGFSTSIPAVYFSRINSRNYRQGLCSDNLHALTFVVGEFNPGGYPVHGDAVLSAVRGLYPSMDEALALSEENEGQAVAVSREYAVGISSFGQALLYHPRDAQTEAVGMSDDGFTFTLAPQYAYLAEDFSETFSSEEGVRINATV